MVKIYESPDGGHTVYQRDFNSTTKELIYEDDWAKRQKSKIEWMHIFEMADSNPTLKKAVEQIFILYRLIKK